MDVMIDIESLDTAPTAPVLSIGACLFDITTGAIQQELYIRIGKANAERYGVPNMSTLQWWMKQSPEARAEAFEGNCPAPRAVAEFREWFRTYTQRGSVRVWGNGSIMDIAILETWMQTIAPEKDGRGRVFPWMFWNIMDMRTIMWLAGMKMPANRGSGHHKALEDARYQVEWVAKAYQKLKGIKDSPDFLQMQYD